LLAIYDELEAASQTVTGIIGAGIIPGALELMDGPACKAVEMTYHAGYPDDGKSIILLIELDGLAEGLDELAERVTAICNDCGAREVRVAATQEERDALWAGRKGALGAMGRLAPNYYQQDSVVPRTKLPEILNLVAEVAKDAKLQATNIFHAGDGNLHPLLLFDRGKKGDIERTLDAAMEITRACIDMGGAITGEHGVGFEKRGVMMYSFTTDDLAAMAKLKRSFNPYDLFNPDKILPASLGCGEARELASSVMPARYAEIASMQPAAPIGTRGPHSPTGAHEHDTTPAELADMEVPRHDD
jgi:glycolate oxidase